MPRFTHGARMLQRQWGWNPKRHLVQGLQDQKCCTNVPVRPHGRMLHNMPVAFPAIGLLTREDYLDKVLLSVQDGVHWFTSSSSPLPFCSVSALSSSPIEVPAAS